MRRSFAARLVLTAAIVFGALVAASPAVAAPADPPNDGYVEYTGTGSTQGMGGASGDYPATVRVECTDGACVLASAAIAGVSKTWEMTQGRVLPLVNGHGEYDMAEAGDICSEFFWEAPGPMTADVTATTATIHRSGSAAPTGACLGDASGTITVSFTAQITATVSGGDPCVLDASCIAAPAGHSSGPSDPGTLSTLPTVADSARPANALWALGLTVVLVLLVAFPAHLLNTAAEHGTDRFAAWWRRTRPKPPELPAWVKRLAGWPLAIAGVVVASLISAFVDPAFGSDAGSSLRIFGSILLAFVLDVAVGWVLLLLYLRRTTPDAQASLRFAPASLLLVVAAVLFSRITGFQPGIVFGLVAGVVIGASLARATKARVALIGLGYSFAVGVVAWLAYAGVTAAAGADPSFAVVFLQETLSAIAIGGMAVLPVALFPLRGMAGFDVFSWNRIVWGVAYAIGLVGFFFVLMPMPFAWEGVPIELGIWVGLYVLYAVAAVGIWAFVTRPWRREAAS